MHVQKSFIRFASLCCFLSVITTLGIHSFFPDAPPNFEDRVVLFRDLIYLINRWWVIMHCLLVIVAMWGFALLQFKKTPGLTGLGFLFFCVFAIAEITRQMMVLFYINGLREQYHNAANAITRDNLKLIMSNAGLLTSPLFGLFILTFGLGGICYGLSLIRTKGFSLLLAIMLIISGIASFVLLGNDFWKSPLLENVMHKYNLSFTPLLRFLIAVWLWKRANDLPTRMADPAYKLV
jgi:hypothetical protein